MSQEKEKVAMTASLITGLTHSSNPAIWQVMTAHPKTYALNSTLSRTHPARASSSSKKDVCAETRRHNQLMLTGNVLFASTHIQPRLGR